MIYIEDYARPLKNAERTASAVSFPGLREGQPVAVDTAAGTVRGLFLRETETVLTLIAPGKGRTVLRHEIVKAQIAAVHSRS